MFGGTTMLHSLSRHASLFIVLALCFASQVRADAPALIDLNSASLKDLETLPGVGPSTAKKIIAGRPYNSVNDLKSAGLSDNQIAKITSPVTASASPAAPSSSDSAATLTPDRIDLNTATDKDLETLPGVGASTAKKFIAGRPYASVDDLKNAGLTDKQVSEISSLVMVSAASVPYATPGSSDSSASPTLSTRSISTPLPKKNWKHSPASGPLPQRRSSPVAPTPTSTT
jgi:DNA uptake protein ComE-like DNA-binding protein